MKIFSQVFERCICAYQPNTYRHIFQTVLNYRVSSVLHQPLERNSALNLVTSPVCKHCVCGIGVLLGSSLHSVWLQCLYLQNSCQKPCHLLSLGRENKCRLLSCFSVLKAKGIAQELLSCFMSVKESSAWLDIFVFIARICCEKQSSPVHILLWLWDKVFPDVTFKTLLNCTRTPPYFSVKHAGESMF